MKVRQSHSWDVRFAEHQIACSCSCLLITLAACLTPMYGKTKRKPAQTPGGHSLRKLLGNELLDSKEHKLYRRLV